MPVQNVRRASLTDREVTLGSNYREKEGKEYEAE
jgi:hypothetical protein